MCPTLQRTTRLGSGLDWSPLLLGCALALALGSGLGSECRVGLGAEVGVGSGRLGQGTESTGHASCRGEEGQEGKRLASSTPKD